MRKTAILSFALCLALLATGCSKTAEISESIPDDLPEESEITEEVSDDVRVTVEELTRITQTDKNGQYISVYPKLIVDGQEASEINESIKDYLVETYPMEPDPMGKYITGYQVRYAWGVKDNIVSIVAIASFLEEDGSVYEVFNYDIDTLEALDDDEVVSALGMTDQDFFDKTEEVYRNYWNTEPWLGSEYNSMLEQSIDAIGYDKITPIILSNGDIGVLGYLYTPTQIVEMERCFDLDTMEVANFRR